MFAEQVPSSFGDKQLTWVAVSILVLVVSEHPMKDSYSSYKISQIRVVFIIWSPFSLKSCFSEGFSC